MHARRKESVNTVEEFSLDAMIVESRDDFAKWAMERANAILVSQGSDLATAARINDENALQDSANALG